MNVNDDPNRISDEPLAETVIPNNWSDILSDYGGMQWLGGVIEGIGQLDPAFPARRDIFLTDADQKAAREQLLLRLELWDTLLGQEGEADMLRDQCLTTADEYQQLWLENISNLVDVCRPLERTYRNLALFFENAGSDTIPNISFVNCATDQLKDPDYSVVFDLVQEEVRRNYDRIDLRSCYSILVLPGYYGANQLLRRWSQLCYENKVLLVTDFEDMDEVDDVMELFDLADLSGGDASCSSTLMCCNWLVGRGKHVTLGETEDLMVPPSGALAGKIYSSLLSQVAAGKKFGIINGTEGVRFDLKKSEIAILERMHLIPMVYQNGKVVASSAKTLFNGENLGLQVYSVVRVFDYVIKVLMDFLNRRAFENFNANIRKELMGQIAGFMDGISGNGKLIEDFRIKRFEQDPQQRDKIHLNIFLKPYFPSKNFMIKMEGKKGATASANWVAYFNQE